MKQHAAKRGGGLTQARKTHDRPLRGDLEIVRGRKSKESLGENSHQGWWRYRRAETEVKGWDGRESGCARTAGTPSLQERSRADEKFCGTLNPRRGGGRNPTDYGGVLPEVRDLAFVDPCLTNLPSTWSVVWSGCVGGIKRRHGSSWSIFTRWSSESCGRGCRDAFPRRISRRRFS